MGDRAAFFLIVKSEANFRSHVSERARHTHVYEASGNARSLATEGGEMTWPKANAISIPGLMSPVSNPASLYHFLSLLRANVSTIAV